MSTEKQAVVLLSGGVDSSTVLAMVKTEGYGMNALSFRYGQRHEVELNAARSVAKNIGVNRHVILNIDLHQFGGSAPTSDIDVAKVRSATDISRGIPVTYVPARNTKFLSFALAWAEVLGSSDIFIDVDALDDSGYPDCRRDFIEAYQRMANLATKAGVEGTRNLRIQNQLMNLSKAEIIQRGSELGMGYALTVSCYDPDASGAAYGQCDSCLLRKRGFAEAVIPDITRY
ncbi:MAG: 7-cyano-7-deazaguanine synthase QueC [Gammaproteobacteria bacterium]|nr:7-cyano-7-deazaguanine synthase QueC [Gammaproteobacteria bacterium]